MTTERGVTMATEQATHRECMNYAPVDAAKGVCHRTKEQVSADGGRCPQFERLAKCGNCSRYTPEEGAPGLGLCEASPARFMAYGDMTAATCGNYLAAQP